MPQVPTRQTGLKTGLIVLMAVLMAGLGLLIFGPERHAPSAAIEQTAQVPNEPALLKRLDAASPELAETTRRVLLLAPPDQHRELLLESALNLFKLEAPRLRYASTEDFDALTGHFRSGVQTLQDNGSDWCKATQVEAYIRLDEAELIPVLIDTFAKDDAAFDWAIKLAGLYLDAIISARAKPVQHGQRNYRDKLLLQDQGRAMGTKNWAMALSIAAFSQAEGQSYEQMREAIDAIDVCELSLAMTDLSNQLPDDTRGRILAELMPETFYGNTPYALSVLTSFFFIG